ncbi:hypothetical protein HD597_005250 [Nonomuraea thailandensis]|uniref:Uncharacterized protein n=1 Tax=Nonomuraea thailandensis TaxID=1188745 RepID=A0A9X2GI56_9ACTN|nr:hypothetical protein [Nonomuraea thailandensis]MCP2358230.1 hypothetical protein [Nonomuraea thailandensis]
MAEAIAGGATIRQARPDTTPRAGRGDGRPVTAAGTAGRAEIESAPVSETVENVMPDHARVSPRGWLNLRCLLLVHGSSFPPEPP